MSAKSSASKKSAEKKVASKADAPRKRGAEGRIHNRVAEELGVAILAGKHLPGNALMNEVDASVRLGISRPAYREAVRVLAAKGLVQSRPKTGTRVAPRNTWNLLDPDVLAWMLKGEPDPQFVRQLFELRSIIEPAAAALAAERRSSQQLSRLGHALEEMSRHGLYTPEGRAADEAFHAEILNATGNETLMALINSISAAIRWTVMFKLRAPKKVRNSIPDHHRLYAAIADADPGAAREAALELIRLAFDDMQLKDNSARAAARTRQQVAA